MNNTIYNKINRFFNLRPLLTDASYLIAISPSIFHLPASVFYAILINSMVHLDSNVLFNNSSVLGRERS